MDESILKRFLSLLTGEAGPSATIREAGGEIGRAVPNAVLGFDDILNRLANTGGRVVGEFQEGVRSFSDEQQKERLKAFEETGQFPEREVLGAASEIIARSLPEAMLGAAAELTAPLEQLKGGPLEGVGIEDVAGRTAEKKPFEERVFPDSPGLQMLTAMATGIAAPSAGAGIIRGGSSLAKLAGRSATETAEAATELLRRADLGSIDLASETGSLRIPGPRNVDLNRQKRLFAKAKDKGVDPLDLKESVSELIGRPAKFEKGEFNITEKEADIVERRIGLIEPGWAIEDKRKFILDGKMPEEINGPERAIMSNEGDLPPVPPEGKNVATGGMSSPDGEPVSKSTSFKRQGMQVGENLLRSFGEAGNEFADKLISVERIKAQRNGVDDSFLNAMPKLNDSQDMELRRFLDQGITPSDPVIKDIAPKVRVWLDEKRQQALDAGIDSGFIDNYLPRYVDPKDIHSRPNDFADALIKANEKAREDAVKAGLHPPPVLTRNQAMQQVGFIQSRSVGRKAGPLEKTREFDLPEDLYNHHNVLTLRGVKRVPIPTYQILQRYGHRVNRRIAEVEQFGKRDEVVDGKSISAATEEFALKNEDIGMRVADEFENLKVAESLRHGDIKFGDEFGAPDTQIISQGKRKELLERARERVGETKAEIRRMSDESRQNSLLERIRAEAGDNGHDLARTIFDRMVGQEDRLEFGDWRSTARNAMIVTKLGLAQIPNALQTAVTLAPVASRTGILRGMNTFRKAVFEALSQKGKQFALDAGAVSNELEKDLLHITSDSLSSQAAGKFLNGVGFSRIERFNNTVAATMGKFHTRDLIDMARQARLEAVEELQKIGSKAGLNKNEISRMISEGATEQDLRDMGFGLARSTQFRATAMDLPIWFSSDRGKFYGQFKSFSISMGRFMLENIDPRKNSPAQISRFLAVLAPAALFAGDTVQFLRRDLPAEAFGDDDDPRSLIGALINKPEKLKEPSFVATRIAEDIAIAGTLGLYQDFVQQAAFGKAAEFAIGPTGGTVSEIVERTVRSGSNDITKAPETFGREMLKQVPIVGRRAEKELREDSPKRKRRRVRRIRKRR